MDASDSRHRRPSMQWPEGPLQGRLLVCRATLPAGSLLQQLLERLLPPCGLRLVALQLEKCRYTPVQCRSCPLLGLVNDLAIESARFLPDGYTAEEAEEFSYDGQPHLPPGGSPADRAQKAALEPVLSALMAQMPALERLALPLVGSDTASPPACLVQRSGLRFLNLDGAYLKTLPQGPYLQGERECGRAWCVRLKAVWCEAGSTNLAAQQHMLFLHVRAPIPMTTNSLVRNLPPSCLQT